MDGGSLSALPWDSGFFKFPVARILLDRRDDNVLACLLLRARHAGFRLVYAMTPCDANVGAGNLAAFLGQLVDQKSTLAKSLAEPVRPEPVCEPGLSIEPWASRELTTELLSLAIESGGRSRYRVDTRMPSGKFESLYRTWMLRSVRRQIADEVLTARFEGTLVGMCTIGLRNGTGNIGLIAVRKDQHGRRVGSSLLHASELWMRERNAQTATMVTQLSNRPAIRMCERRGFALVGVQDIYHFWPNEKLAGLQREAA